MTKSRYKKIRASMRRRVFNSLKVGMRVHDTWYGNGVVLEKTQRRICIRLYKKRVTWSYDVAHVEGFIRKGFKHETQKASNR